MNPKATGGENSAALRQIFTKTLLQAAGILGRVYRVTPKKPGVGIVSRAFTLLVLCGFAGIWTHPLNAQISTEQFCEALNMTAADCALVSSVSTSRNHPWEVTSENAFEGTALRSASSIHGSDDMNISDLEARLSGQVAGVEFYRRVSSETIRGQLIFTYNNIPSRQTIFTQQSLESYQNLPFYGSGDRLLGGADISGLKTIPETSPHDCPRSFQNGRLQSLDSEVQFGPNGEYSRVRLLPDNAALITELRWRYNQTELTFFVPCGEQLGMIDRLQLHPALTTTTQLCSALDLDSTQCSLLQSLTLPTTQHWTIDDGQNLGATGGSALRVPFQVGALAERRSCLVINTDLPAGRWTFGFRWRPDTASANQLSFRVNNSVLDTLPGSAAGTWTIADHRIIAEEPITSLSWCHSAATGSVLSYGWIDQLNIAENVLPVVIPLLGGLTDDADAAATISPGDLLLGLHLVGENGVDGQALTANLPVATELNLVAARSDLMGIMGNPQQRAVLDIDRNDTVDHRDFRLMLRYRTGLRGAALCDELCHNRLELLLGQ